MCKLLATVALLKNSAPPPAKLAGSPLAPAAAAGVCAGQTGGAYASVPHL
jgi:hypothetical protein